MTVLKTIKFGHIAAEEEAANLQKYFLKTPEYEEIVSDQNKILVIGRKGSGKSAIYVAIQNHFKETGQGVVEGLTFTNYPWAIHAQLKDVSGSAETAYYNTWKYFILMTMAKNLVRFNEPMRYRFLDLLWWRKRFNSNLRQIERFLRQNYGPLVPTIGDILTDRARNIRRLNIATFGAEAPQTSDDALRLVKSINVICTDLEKLVLGQLPKNAPWFILFDQLDLGWDGSDDYRTMLIGLILAARDLVRQATGQGIDLHAVVFLRSDIYDSLRFQDKNKLSPSVVSLNWTDDKLLELVNTRLRSTGGVLWDDVFTEDRMRQLVTKFDYIERRTMLRPRDMIQYCLLAHGSALRTRARRIGNAHIYGAEPEYSAYMRNEIRDENFSQYPIDVLLEIIQNDLATEKFEANSLKQVLTQRQADLGMDVDAALKLLIELSILGVKKIGGKGGGSTITYRYRESPETRLEPSGELTVHPSLRRNLNLREVRRRANDLEPNVEADLDIDDRVEYAADDEESNDLESNTGQNDSGG